ncbi:MAG TPA: DUF2905 domain-containing protein [Burkholderiales bacterium]|nr:DUF2905 domain-containing protein [Burkholderiales bacterium]
MMKWLITVVVVLVVFSLVAPRMGRFGLGRLPGDFQVPARGRIYYIPIASTLVLSLAVWLLGKII